ncbi:ABC transporter permease subunit [Paracandidimonas soli]|uniref:ABC transporter permease subunit n=1 Tax=Paracandidimonas soli TaxID=1917182 RepID=UPI0033405074
MEISQEFSLTAKPADVWTALKDIRLVASCLPGAEVLETNEDGTSAKGRLSMRLGPISVGFDGQATITRDDESMQASLDGKGVDPKSSSRAQMKMQYRVVPEGEGSRMIINAQIALSGMLAQFSKGQIVQDIAAQLTGVFASRLQAALEPKQDASEGAGTAAPASAAAIPDAPALNPMSLLLPVLGQRLRQLMSGDIVLPVAFALLCLLIWEGVTRYFQISPVLLPAPSAVWDRMMETMPLLLHHAYPTVWESVVGFIIATFLGVALAALLSASRLMRSMLYPNVVFFQLIPKIALAPLFIVWLGIGYESRLTFSVFISFFPIVIAALAGLDNVDKSLLRLCRALTASSWQTFVSVRFPHAIPYIFSGMKIATTFAIIGVIVGEFITSQEGLGYLILFASAQADTALILASITVLCIFGLAFYGLVVILEKVARAKFGA